MKGPNFSLEYVQTLICQSTCSPSKAGKPVPPPTKSIKDAAVTVNSKEQVSYYLATDNRIEEALSWALHSPDGKKLQNKYKDTKWNMPNILQFDKNKVFGSKTKITKAFCDDLFDKVWKLYGPSDDEHHPDSCKKRTTLNPLVRAAASVYILIFDVLRFTGSRGEHLRV